MAVPEVESHTYQYIENLQVSPQAFYQALDFSIMRRGIPGMDQTRVDYHEGSMFSAKREYLRLSRDRVVFDVCAAPFGTGFFVSWRLVRTQKSWIKLSSKVAFSGFLFILIFCLLIALTGNASAAISVFWSMTGLLLVLSVINMLVYWILQNWLKQMDERFMTSPFLSELYAWVLGKDTYYRIDTMLMFKEAVALAIQETIQTFTGIDKIKPLSEEERKPVMEELFETPVE